MKNLNKAFTGLLASIILIQPLSVFAYSKKENVYVNLNTDGTVIKSVVNNQLSIKNIEDIEDQTLLNNITNLNGHEEYSLKDNSLIWKANGKDILYSGLIEKAMPISVKATYYLNDKEIDVKKLSNKKGKVKIVLDLTNNAIDTETGLYIPFVVTVGTTISSKNNSNVEITNGKVINNGNTNVALAIAAPGLYESLGIDELKSLNKVTISFDTTNFSMNNIYFVATPKLLEDSDLDIFNKMSDITSSISTLQENMNKIEEGSKSLSDGANTLSDGATSLSSALNEANEGMNKLQSGSISLDEGLKQIISALNNAQSLLANQNLSGSLENLKYLKSKNNEAIATLKQSLNSINTVSGLTEEQILNVNSILSDTIKTNEQKVYALVAGGYYNQQTATNVLSNYSLITLLSANNTAIDTTINSLTSLSEQITKLVTELNTALISAEKGSSELSNGISTLKTGINAIYEGSTTLKDGAISLSSGASELSNGIVEFNKQGINKLSSYADKINNYSYKVEKLIELSKNYKGFASNNANETTFIYKMKSVK